ncbi:MCM DNA helicase complex subunit mcm6 [Trifolium repens]|nr:minichromosome maintenance (MCM2/3/5) family protein [Trifolium repens]WJX23697.1 MCM DNA helicase complex subunit mcm6 [Trifolium repens]
MINISFYNIPIVNGVVTRTNEVRLELLKGTFKCLECGGIIKNVKQQFKYTEPTYVYMQPVTIEQSGRYWAKRANLLIGKRSELRRMQETSKEIPAGCLLRSLDVILRHEIVEHARAGLLLLYQIYWHWCAPERGQNAVGKLLNARVPHLETKVTGLKALGVRDVFYNLTFIANSVQICDGRKETDIRNRKKDSDEDDQQFTAQELDKVQRMRNTRGFFIKLVDSIALEVCRHREVKRGICLILVGGVHISICAKSQFLKYTSNIVPRSVYTSGKSSSAAGQLDCNCCLGTRN